MHLKVTPLPTVVISNRRKKSDTVTVQEVVIIDPDLWEDAEEPSVEPIRKILYDDTDRTLQVMNETKAHKHAIILWSVIQPPETAIVKK